MHFALEFGEAGSLGSLLATLAGAAPEQKEIAHLLRLAETNRVHLGQLTALAKEGLVNITSDDGDALEAIREQFDRAVALAPEAAVALYSLGSADILEHATTEIVDRLAEWGLLQPDATVLDIGCGIGRIERGLALQVGAITAIDVSLGMIEEARRRCRDLANVAFEQCDGGDLTGFGDRSFDLVLAVELVSLSVRRRCRDRRPTLEWRRPRSSAGRGRRHLEFFLSR